MRLNKYLATNLGVSRREADDIIASGKVKIGDKIATLGDKVPEKVPTNGQIGDKAIDFSSQVWYNGSIVSPLAGFTYLALNKPVGYVSSRKPQDAAPTLYELLPEKYQNLKTVGRLDKNSSGLILLTDDGDFAFQMTHPKFSKAKLYEVTLDQPLQPLHQQMLSDFGVDLPDGKSQLILTPLSLPTLSDAKTPPSHPKSPQNPRKNWLVELHEGRNRQIRRSFGALGYTVETLHRTQFGPYQLANLTPGKYQEIQKL